MTFLVLAILLTPRRKKRMWCLPYRDRVDDTLYRTGDLGHAQDEQEFVTFIRGQVQPPLVVYWLLRERQFRRPDADGPD
jgi:hypothetical protein